MRRSLLAGLFLLGCNKPPTGIVVEVSSDLRIPDELDRVTVVVSNSAGQSLREVGFDLGAGGLPSRLGLEPDGKGLGPIIIEATGLRAMEPVVSRRATVSFEKERVVVLVLPLLSRCRGQSCPPGNTCVDTGSCADQTVHERLPAYLPGVAPPGRAVPPDEILPDGGQAGPEGGQSGPDGTGDVAVTPPAGDGPADDGPPPPDGPTSHPEGGPPPDTQGPPRTTGTACTAGAQCVTGQCIDGFCCASSCTGLCQACAMSKTGKPDGQCAPVSAGTNPDRDCTADPVNPCGSDGTCDGAGACRLQATTVKCADAACNGSTFTPARQCDGSGKCQDPRPASCGLFLCTAAGCKQTCAGDGDCASVKCVDGSCGGKRATGAACASAVECSSGACVDGVCCGTACNKTCEACIAAKTGQPDGTCASVSANTDPDNECPDEGSSTCGYDGKCNGAGACRRYASNTVCVAASCNGGTFTPARLCDGQGTCQTASANGCGNFTCTASGCRTSCSGDQDCVGGNVCILGNCGQKKAQGVMCSGAAECTSGACVDGFCCENSCGGLCQACAMSKTGAANGLCRPVSTGTDPDNECTAQSPGTCGTDGFCDGANACRKYGASTPCGTGSCNGNTYVSGGTCNGSGTCVVGSGTPCAPYACTASGCKTSCGHTTYYQDPDCAPGYGCKDYSNTCAALNGTWFDMGYVDQSGVPSGTPPPALGAGCVLYNGVVIAVTGLLQAGTECEVVRNASDDATWCTPSGKYAFRQTDLQFIRQCGTTSPTWGPTSYSIDHLPAQGHSIWCLPTTTSPQYVDCLTMAPTPGVCQVNNKYVSRIYRCF